MARFKRRCKFFWHLWGAKAQHPSWGEGHRYTAWQAWRISGLVMSVQD